MSHPNEQRRNLFQRLLAKSDPELRLVSHLLIILASNFVLFLALAFAMPATAGYLLGVPQWGIDELLRRVDLLSLAVVLPLGCTFLCLLAQGLVAGLRIAGPARRFVDVATRLQGLCIPRGVHVRRDDYLRHTAHELSLGLERVHDEVRAMRDLAEGADRDDPAAAQVALEQIRLRLSQFNLVGASPGCEPVAASPLPEAVLAGTSAS
jgi:hypothetical protein